MTTYHMHLQVTVKGQTCEGRGPNKRLAKRYAAETMLEMLGYAQPLPDPPAKPAIKMTLQVGFFADFMD